MYHFELMKKIVVNTFGRAKELYSQSITNFVDFTDSTSYEN